MLLSYPIYIDYSVTPHQDNLYHINYHHPPSSSQVTPNRRPFYSSSSYPISDLIEFHLTSPPSVSFTRPHHSVSPEHQSVHHTKSVSFARASSNERNLFRFLIMTNLLYYIYHIINKTYFILLYTYLWYRLLCL